MPDPGRSAPRRLVASRGIRRPSVTVGIDYEGRPVQATPGTSVASALLAAGLQGCRVAPDGDRGVFCGMGVCGECTVMIDGAPALACLTEVHDGMRVGRLPLRPPVRFDAPAPGLPEHDLAPECLVIGGGPAGLAAATSAATAGVETLLIDERTSLGGQFYKQPAYGFELEFERLDAQYRGGRELIDRTESAGARILNGVRVWGGRPGEALAGESAAVELYASGAESRWTLRPQRLILATGAYERAVPFPGWTLPGVMTTGAAQSLLRAYQVAPGTRVLVAGNGPLNIQLAAELVRAGFTVVALAELADVFGRTARSQLVRMASAAPRLAADGLRFLASIRAARVPLLTGATVIEASGADRVERAVVARIGTGGRPVPGSERTFEVDAVCLGMGFMSGAELARVLGARHALDPATGGVVIERTGEGRTSLPGVWAIGDGAEVRGSKVAEAAGALAGLDVAASLGRSLGGTGHRARAAAHRAHARHRRFQRALWSAYRGPRLIGELASPETIICRCESVTLAELQGGLAEVASAGALKRLSRVGMGRCQGRFCGAVVADLVAQRTGTPAGPLSGFAPQLPVRPTPVAVLAAPPVDG
jgi:NADPH-dependent 2,4-dienoyl-CoA reductase/sulfur reductase-like enzyme